VINYHITYKHEHLKTIISVGGKMKKTEWIGKIRPFHETIVDEIKLASNHEIPQLIRIITSTIIPKNHDKIISAWKKRVYEVNWDCSGKDDNVVLHLRQQKTEMKINAK
jgi:hypothetical protein